MLAALSTAVLAVRGAMQARRERAAQAWLSAHSCVVNGMDQPTVTRTESLRLCASPLRQAAELALELPERGRREWEFDAAVHELVAALASSDEHRVTSALDHGSRAAEALGWRSAMGAR